MLGRGSSATPLFGLVLRIGLLLQDVRVSLTLRSRRAALQLLWRDLRPDRQAVKVEGWTDQIRQQPLLGRLCSPCLCARLGRSYTGGDATRLGRGGRDYSGSAGSVRKRGGLVGCLQSRVRKRCLRADALPSRVGAWGVRREQA